VVGNASPNYVATAVVLIRIAVGVRVIATRISIRVPISIRVTVGVVVIRVAEAEAAAPEVAITESTTTKFTAATKFTTMESAGHPAATESAAAEAASHAAMESATAKAAAVETATAKAATKAAAMAATKAATAHAASMAATTATTATATSAATRQRHCRRSQANGRNRQQRDNRFTQHNHSPSETLAPNHNTPCRWQSFWKTATGFDESITQLSESVADQFKFREQVVRLNSKSEIKLSARRRSNSLLQIKLELEFFAIKELLFEKGNRIRADL
jgi:hypothetical protein